MVQVTLNFAAETEINHHLIYKNMEKKSTLKKVNRMEVQNTIVSDFNERQTFIHFKKNCYLCIINI